jgi:hypothetical protein
MGIWTRSRRSRPLRYFVYISDLKVQMLLDQISEPVRRSIAAELKLDFKLVSLTLSSPAVDTTTRQRSRIEKLAVVEQHIRRYEQVGDLTARHGWLAGEADLDWKPLEDGETVLFTGHAKELLIGLGGSVSHLIGRPTSEMQVGSHPPTIRAAVLDGSAAGSADFGRNLQAAARALYSLPQPVRFLARAISRQPLPDGSAQDEYLLATPLFVEAVNPAQSGLEVP